MTRNTNDGSAAGGGALGERLLEALERLTPAQLAESGFDAEKVARIRAAIRDGSFAVDSDAVAGALLARIYPTGR